MNTLRAAAIAAMITGGLLVAPAPAQARTTHTTAQATASTLQAPARRAARWCPPEYRDHELGCTLYRVPRRR